MSCPYLAEHAKLTAAFIDVIVLTLDIIKGVSFIKISTEIVLVAPLVLLTI